MGLPDACHIKQASGSSLPVPIFIGRRTDQINLQAEVMESGMEVLSHMVGHKVLCRYLEVISSHTKSACRCHIFKVMGSLIPRSCKMVGRLATSKASFSMFMKSPRKRKATSYKCGRRCVKLDCRKAYFADFCLGFISRLIGAVF